MNISYTNTFRDLLAFQRYHASRSPVVIVMDLGLVAFVSYLFFQATAGDSAHQLGLTTRIIATLVLAVVLLALVIASNLVLFVLVLISRRNKTLLTEHTITLGEDGFVTETAYERTNSKWASVQKLRRTRRHLFIYVSQHGAHVVPRRAFREEAEWNAFHEFCRRKAAAVPAATGASTD